MLGELPTVDLEDKAVGPIAPPSTALLVWQTNCLVSKITRTMALQHNGNKDIKTGFKLVISYSKGTNPN